MRIAAVLVSYALAVLALAPYLDGVQRNRYKPLGRVRKGWPWVDLAIAVYALALSASAWLWWPDEKWVGAYVLAAFLPEAVWLAVRIKGVRPRLSARFWRLYAVAAALLAAPMACALVKAEYVYWWGVCGTIGYLVAAVAAGICYPLETRRNRRFEKREAETLAKSNACLIGVTGSAGKTTVKRLIVSALGEGAYATKGNYNTPIGIALSIREMPAGTKWFVAEMGVGKPDDMKELLALYRPKVGVVTCVLPQHTAKFDRVEDIRQEKCRLLDQVEWGICHTSVGYPAHATFGEGGDWWAENVRLDKEGVSLTVCNRRERADVRLTLPGRQNVDNALCAYAVARHLGATPEEIRARWATVKGEPHRLEVKKNARGVWIVDDGYNCNIRGAEYALEYLRLYEGRKVVATSGIDESDDKLGLNVRLGEMIAQTADVAVIVGDRYEKELRQGLGGYVPVYSVPNTEKSVALYAGLLREGDVLLIMADYKE